MEHLRGTSRFATVVPAAKLIVKQEGVFLHPQTLTIEVALSIIVVGLILKCCC
ncbi:hypothetical protein Ahy_B03g061774 isoform D [Arachis hypogaea]|uniref:Uncharacterized protein n=1 Tax=Arachis hypogaea TaxID=3818 RepID=A0A444ZRV4_ARAHY|nr:hypothetical protein Ahy_B03g061774 isoform D [Arachis hypogaea]